MRRGGSQQRPEETDTTEVLTAESPQEDPSVEITHDEFDPTGTLALTAVWISLLALLWVFMYFVEFLGNGPSVLG